MNRKGRKLHSGVAHIFHPPPPHFFERERAHFLLWYGYGVTRSLSVSRQVVIVPGYGLAVAGAQYAIADTVKLLTRHGVKVSGARRQSFR